MRYRKLSEILPVIRARGRHIKALLIGSAVLVLLGVIVIGQSPPVAIPFATTPFLSGTSSGPNSGAVILDRKVDGSYLQFVNSPTPPFSIVSNMSALAELLAGGINNLVTAPAGPANVGLSSQAVAGGKFTTAGAPGGIFIPFGEATSITVYLASTAGIFAGSQRYAVGPGLAGGVSGGF